MPFQDILWEDIEKHKQNILERREKIQHLLSSRINRIKEKDFIKLSKTILCEKYGNQRNHRRKFLADMGLSADPKNRDDESIYRQFIGNKSKKIYISNENLLRISARIIDNKLDAYFLFLYSGKYLFCDEYASYLNVLNDFYDLNLVDKNPEQRYEYLSALIKKNKYEGIDLNL